MLITRLPSPQCQQQFNVNELELELFSSIYSKQKNNSQKKYLFSENWYQVMSTVFSENSATNKAFLIMVGFANAENLSQEFICRRAELARRYGCSDRNGTRLIQKIIDADLVKIVKNQWCQNRRAFLRTYRLTKYGRMQVEKTLKKAKISVGDENAAVIDTEVFDLSENPEQTPHTFAEEKEILGALDNRMYRNTMPVRPTNKPKLCSPEAFDVGKLYCEDYLGFFKDFNEKKRFACKIGQIFDKKGLTFTHDMMTDLGVNIREHHRRREALWNYMADILRE